MNFQNILIGTMVAVLVTSCAPGSSKSGAPKDDVQTLPAEGYVETKEADIKRECSKDEAAMLNSLESALKASDKSIDQAKNKKEDKAIESATDAIIGCDTVIANLVDACFAVKKTVVNPKGTVTYYDQYRVDQKCQKSENYLVANNARPAKNSQPPVVTQPPTKPPVSGNPPVKPPVNPPVKPPVVTPGTSRQCSDNEFTKLSEGLGQLDAANKNIAKLGATANWKYDSSAISTAALATKSCESLIAYHDQQSCERTVNGNVRQYSGNSLRERCVVARTYFYEFVQNSKTLNFKNADLFLNISSFQTKTFEADYIDEVQGCRVENISGQDINYSGKDLVLVKDSRGFETKMMVLETAEGLLVQCYGLKIDGPFSKRELVKVLKEAGTNMPLVYKLK